MTCDIYKDLLIPFMEDTCSSATKELLEGHLAECEECRKELERYRVSLLIPENQNQGKTAEQTQEQGEYREAGRPFRRIAAYIRRLWAAVFVLALLLGVIGAYFGVAQKQGYYVADKLFFRVKDENIMSGELRRETENYFMALYCRIYYQLIDREQYYKKEASLEEIIAKGKELRNLQFHWDAAQLEISETNRGSMDITIPVTAAGDEIPMELCLSGIRIGIGQYYFKEMQISRKDVWELGYHLNPYIALALEDKLLWPGQLPINITVNALTKGTEGTIGFLQENEQEGKLVDTGKTLPVGTYRYEDESHFDELTIYPDRTLTRRRGYLDGNREYSNAWQGLGMLNAAAEPVRYFITADESGRERLYTLTNAQMGMSAAVGDVILEIGEDGFSFEGNSLGKTAEVYRKAE